jgi:DNA-binding CsgD family transcriptional regulator
MATPGSHHVPRSIGAAAEAVVAARRTDRLARVFHRNPVPMVMVGGERRFVEVNRPARLVFRLTLEKLRALRMEDLIPPARQAAMEEVRARLMGTGYAAGTFEVAVPDGGRFDVVYYGLANALPGLHVFAFAPADWSEEELGIVDVDEPAPSTALTPRELEVLQLAARGSTGPRIADELVLSPATVKTHFEHVYEKLGVTDRAAAVARAMRLGLID